MSGPAHQPQAAAPPVPQAGGAPAAVPHRKGHYSLLTGRDKLTLTLMVGIPTFLCLFFIWLPTIASVGLSLTNWGGVTALTGTNFVGLKNYEVLFTQYSLFWPAVWHNILWLLVLVFIATPIGIFFAVLLDREMRGTRIYQSAFFVPVVLSLAIVGFIWEQMYTSQGFINSVLGHTSSDTAIDFLGDPVSQPVGRPRRRQLAACGLCDGPVPGGAQERRPDPP